DPKARGLTVRTANAGPSLTAYGAWNLDYPQLYSYVVRPLPADVVPIDTTLASGYAWGIGSIYVGELAVAESFQAIPPSVDRSAVLVGRQQPPNVDSLTADISEIRVYKGALDATKLETEQRWLESEWHLCDGVDFQSDPANCGGCGVLCTAGAKCDFGVCNDVDLASWELVNRSSGTSSVLIGPPDTSPDGGAAHAVSWAQAENTCALEGFPLATPTTTDDNNLLSGNFASASVTRNRSVGALRENGSARSAVDLSALAFAPYAGTTPYGCTDMRADGSWITTPGCNASGARDWACLLPAVPLPTIAGCMTFGDAAPGKHAYAICPQVYPNEPTRKAACAALKVGANNGSELVIESASQAAAVGLLRTGPYPVAFDLTSARKNPRWTLGNGSPAPLIAWDGTFNHQTSVPPFVVGPACATLNMDGTMSDESCFAPSTVACALPDGTPAPTAIRSFSPSFNFASPSGGSLGVSLIDTAGTATQPVPFVLTHVKPGDHIVATFNFSGSWQFIGQTVTMTVGSYPGSTTCVSAYYVGSNTWAQTSDWSYPFTAGLPGVYLIAVDPNNITGCTAPNWSLNGAFPLTIGAIQVDAQ
ncbi:MAG TPA: hypothetical protein VF407_20660, partial [Polyangiaceae bacterium]